MKSSYVALFTAWLFAWCLVSTPASAKPLGPAPVQWDCLVYKGAAPCVYNIGFIEFDIGQHLLRVGQKVTGTYSWGLTPTRGATMLKSGPGLKLISCSSPTDVAELGSSGSATCTWKAVEKTNGWSTSLGINLSQNASLGSYTENDYYAILGKDEMTISGTITREDFDGSAHGLTPGIPGIKVDIKAKGVRTISVTTNENGFYFANIKKAGTYTITPTLSAKYATSADPITPKSRKVRVAKGKHVTADFVIEDDLNLEATIDRTDLAANGIDVATITLKVTRFGDPVGGNYISVIPNRESVGTDPQNIPVPMLLCSTTTGGIWPPSTATRGLTSFVAPPDVYTDPNGEFKIKVQVGTVPGTMDLQFWLKDNSGKLRYENLTKVQKAISLKVAPTAPAPQNLAAEMKILSEASGVTLNSYYFTLGNQLGELKIRGVAFSPVYGARLTGLVVLPEGQRILYGQSGLIDAVPPGAMVLASDHLASPLLLGYGSFDGVIKGGALPELPPYSTWRAGSSSPGWSFTDQSTSPVYSALPSWYYSGFPYPYQKGGC